MIRSTVIPALLGFVLAACGTKAQRDLQSPPEASTPSPPSTPSDRAPPSDQPIPHDPPQPGANTLVPLPSIRWMKTLSNPDESYSAQVALNPNGRTGLVVWINFAGDQGDWTGWPTASFEVRTYDVDGNELWINRSPDKAPEPVAIRQGFRAGIQSWSSSFVLLSEGPFSFGCASRQDPWGVGLRGGIERARFFDENGSCIRNLALGDFVMTFAADPDGTVWFQSRTEAMAPSCAPPSIVNSDGAFVFDGGSWIDNVFDPSSMLQWPFKRFEDGRIFGARQGTGCNRGDGAIGILVSDYTPAWTVAAFGGKPFDVGGGDFATVAEHPDAITFGASSVPAGDGFVAFRFRRNGRAKSALRFASPFEHPKFLHADARGFIVSSSPGYDESETGVAAIGWDGRPQWQGMLPCVDRGGGFAAHPQHGLRFTCSVPSAGETRQTVRLIAVER